MTLNAPTAYPVFYRSYSRRTASGDRESWEQAINRAIDGLAKVGKLSPIESESLRLLGRKKIAMPSGRWLWVGGTDWVYDPDNFAGAYNCSSTDIVDTTAFGLLMDLAMTGCGTGAVLESRCIDRLRPIRNELTVTVTGKFGDEDPGNPDTIFAVSDDGDRVTIQVGDSRKGWVSAYQGLIELAMSDRFTSAVAVTIDISHVRPIGRPLKGFGGVANPSKLPELFPRVAQITNGAIGRQLTAEECCLLIDEAAIVVVSGNIRRSAGIRQFDATAPLLKENLWVEVDGKWRIDPKRDALRAANHTRVYHTKPTESECIEAVRKQFQSGEGAIQYAPEAIARASADLLNTDELRRQFLAVYTTQGKAAAGEFLLSLAPELPEQEVNDRLHRYGLNPCFGAGTMILVREPDGVIQQPIESLIGKTVEVFDGERWVEIDNFRVTGRNRPMLRIELGSGSAVRTTEYHDFILEDGTRKQARDLEVGDRLLHMTDDEDGNDLGWFYTVVAIAPDGIDAEVYCCTVPTNNRITLASGLITGQCGEIIMRDNFCNLAEIHLNQIDPMDIPGQIEAFKGAGLLAAPLLHHDLTRVDARYQYSRSIDPIVGVSFTGLFDFFVKAFGVDWLRWWEAGRPDEWGQTMDDLPAWSNYVIENLPWFKHQSEFFKAAEAGFLSLWRDAATQSVWDYCDRHGLRRPNRCTTVQPSGSKSLLTGASPGWHPPKAARFIRRITFSKNDPIALACLDYGYSIVPSQSDKDESGNLLTDPFDPRCTEWLVEIPVAVDWADLPGADTIAIERFSALAQFDFYMQVQTHYTTHNTSATIELRENEIEDLGQRIHQAITNDEGYISAALLARFDDLQTFPRLPFEPIDRDTYDRLAAEVIARRQSDDFHALLAKHDRGVVLDAAEQGPAGCDSDKCLLPSAR